MKRVLFGLLTALIFFVPTIVVGASAPNDNVKPCQLMQRPVNPEGEVDWNTQCLFTLQEPAVFSMNYRKDNNSIGRVTCEVQPGTSFVKAKESGEWLKIRACFNDDLKLISPANPRGRLDCAPPQLPPEVVEVVREVPALPVEQPPVVSSPIAPTVTIVARIKGNEVTEKIKRKSSVTLVWYSQNATECHSLTGKGFHTGGSTDGSVETPPLTHDELYTVVCTGVGGETSDEVRLDINNHNGRWIAGGVALLVGGVVVSRGGGDKKQPIVVPEGPTIP